VINLKAGFLLANPPTFLKKMKVGDSVYLVTDQLKTGAGIPAMICGIQESTVKVAIEEINGTKVLQVQSWDLLPLSLFTNSVLNVVYESYLEIECDHGSILNLKPDAIVRKLIEHSLAPQTARQCVDFLDEIDWRHTQLPLRQWLKRIRAFYYGKP
jgi:hypothetical protein